jgi:hypothetical protein
MIHGIAAEPPQLHADMHFSGGGEGGNEARKKQNFD